MPDTVAQAAQVAQQGFQDLGGGLRRLGDANKSRAVGEKVRETLRNTPEGDALATSVSAGQMTGGQAIQLSDQMQNVSPVQVFGSLLKASLNPNLSEEDKLAIKKKIHYVASVMGMMSSMKKGTAAPSILNSDKAFVESLDFVLSDAYSKGKIDKVSFHKKRAKLLGMKAAFGKEGVIPRDFQGEVDDLLDFTNEQPTTGNTEQGTEFDDILGQ